MASRTYFALLVSVLVLAGVQRGFADDESKSECPETTSLHDCADRVLEHTGIQVIEALHWTGYPSNYIVPMCCHNEPSTMPDYWARQMGLPGDGSCEYGQANDIDLAEWLRYDDTEDCRQFTITIPTGHPVMREWSWVGGWSSAIDRSEADFYYLRPLYLNEGNHCNTVPDPQVYGPIREITVSGTGFGCDPMPTHDFESLQQDYETTLPDFGTVATREIGNRKRFGGVEVVATTEPSSCGASATGTLTPRSTSSDDLASIEVRFSPIVPEGLTHYNGSNAPGAGPFCAMKNCKISRAVLCQIKCDFEADYTLQKFVRIGQSWVHVPGEDLPGTANATMWSSRVPVRCCHSADERQLGNM